MATGDMGMRRCDACVFDAYGTLFNFDSAVLRCRDALGARAGELSALWRAKQLQYTWLRSLMGSYADFLEVTGDALDFALAALGLEREPLRRRLIANYFELDAYPEVPATLGALRAGGLTTAILSNGTPQMLSAAVEHAELGSSFDAVLSVDEVRTYKPHPSVYRLVPDRLGVEPRHVCFVSSNGWDAHGGAAFGFFAVWLNRIGQGPERLPGPPGAVIAALDQLPRLLGIGPKG